MLRHLTLDGRELFTEPMFSELEPLWERWPQLLDSGRLAFSVRSLGWGSFKVDLGKQMLAAQTQRLYIRASP